MPRPIAPSDLPIRGASDGWVIATAVAGGADVLVTGDGDLLEFGGATPLPIVTPRQFWEMLRMAEE